MTTPDGVRGPIDMADKTNIAIFCPYFLSQSLINRPETSLAGPGVRVVVVPLPVEHVYQTHQIAEEASKDLYLTETC